MENLLSFVTKLTRNVSSPVKTYLNIIVCLNRMVLLLFMYNA